MASLGAAFSAGDPRRRRYELKALALSNAAAETRLRQVLASTGWPSKDGGAGCRRDRSRDL
jgi:hypothetical protein